MEKPNIVSVSMSEWVSAQLKINGLQIFFVHLDREVGYLGMNNTQQSRWMRRVIATDEMEAYAKVNRVMTRLFGENK